MNGDRQAALVTAFALALASAVSLGLARFSYALLLPAMRADLGWSYFTAGAMNTCNAAGYLLGALLAPRALARLATLVREQEAMVDDPVSFQISDREFHSTLYAACGNSLLADVVSDFYDYALDYRRRALKRKGAIARSVADHRAIVEAMKTRDPDRAAAAMADHLEQVRKTTLKEMAS